MKKKITKKNVEKSTAQNQKNLRHRNWAVFLLLLAFVALVYAVTMVKIRLYGGF